MLGNRNMSSLINVNPNVLKKLNLNEVILDKEDNEKRIKGTFLNETARELTSLVYDGVMGGRQKSFLLTGRPGFGKSHVGLYLMNFLGNPIDNPVMEHVICDSERFPHSRMKQEIGNYLVVVVPPIDINTPLFNSAIIGSMDAAMMREGLDYPPPSTGSAPEYVQHVVEHIQRMGRYNGVLFVMDDFESVMIDIERKSGSETASSLVEFLNFISNASFPILFLAIGSMFPMKYITKGMEEEAKRRFTEIFNHLIWMDYSVEEWVEFVTTTLLHHPSMEALEVLTSNMEFEKLANFAYEAGLFQDRGVDYIQHKLLPTCFPLHPFTLVFLPRLSQKVCHTEKNLISFFRDTGAGSFRHFLDTFGIFQASGKLSMFTPDYLFSYYEKAIKGSPHMRNVAEAINKANILSNNNPLARRMIRLITLMQLVKDEIIRPTKKNIFNSLQFDDREVKRMETLIVDMIQKKGFKYDRNTSEIRLPIQKSSVNLQEFIERRIEKIQVEARPSEVLNQKYKLEDVFAKAYNDTYYTDRKLQCLYVGMDELRDPNFPHILTSSLGRGRGEYAGDVAILYLVTGNDEDLMEARNIAKSSDWENISRVVIAVPVRPANFFKVVWELEALDQIREKEPIFADPDSDEREMLEERASELKNELTEKLEFFRRSDRFYWYFRSNLIHQIQEKTIQELSDAMMEENFPFSPVIPNPAVSSFADSDEYVGIRKAAVEKIFGRPGSIIIPLQITEMYDGLLFDVLINTGIVVMANETSIFQEFVVSGPLEEETAVAAVWDTLYARILQSVEEGIRVIPINDVLWDLLQPPYGINPALIEIMLAVIFHACPWKVEIFKNFRQMRETGDHSSLLKMDMSYETVWNMVHDPEDIIVYFSEMTEEDLQQEAEVAPAQVAPRMEPEVPQGHYVPEQTPLESERTDGPGQTVGGSPQENLSYQDQLSMAVSKVYPTQAQSPQPAPGYPGVDRIPSDEPYSTVEMNTVQPQAHPRPVQQSVAPPRQTQPPVPGENYEKIYLDQVVELFAEHPPRPTQEVLWYEARSAIFSWFDTLPPITRHAEIQKGKEILGFLELVRGVGRDVPAHEFFTRYLPPAMGFNPVEFSFQKNGAAVVTIFKNIKSFLLRYQTLKDQTLWKAISTIFAGKKQQLAPAFAGWIEKVPQDLPVKRLSEDARLLLDIAPGGDMKKVFMEEVPKKMGIGPVDKWEIDRNMEYLSRLSKAKLEVEVSFVMYAFELPKDRSDKEGAARIAFRKTFEGFGFPREKQLEYLQEVSARVEKG